jgi:hypothetical protein
MVWSILPSVNILIRRNKTKFSDLASERKTLARCRGWAFQRPQLQPACSQRLRLYTHRLTYTHTNVNYILLYIRVTSHTVLPRRTLVFLLICLELIGCRTVSILSSLRNQL